MTVATSNSKQDKSGFFHKFNHTIIIDLIVILICCLSFGLSWIESLINTDSHHWGLMYVSAIDLKKGLIPYKDSLIIYGYLTSLIQSLFLSLFGEKLLVIGIVTGLFHSLNIFLAYVIFQKFLPKYLAGLSAFIYFLLHGYMAYPWANYYSFTFVLIAIIFFIDNQKNTSVLIAGFFVGISILSRYTAMPAFLTPFLIFLVYEFMTKNTQKQVLIKGLYFLAGFLIPLILFASYLTSYGVLDDFFVQNKIMAEAWSRGVTIITFLPRLISSILQFRTAVLIDSRSVFFTIQFFWCWLVIFYLFRKFYVKKVKLNQEEELIILITLFTLFSYLNSVHIYEVFRLINGSSLGIGIIFYSLMKIVNHLEDKNKKKIVLMGMTIFVSAICFIWSSSLILTPSSSVPRPWNIQTLTGQGVSTNKISLFQGKLLSKDYYNFYDEMLQKMSKIPDGYYIINYTRDPIPMVISELPRVQILPIGMRTEVSKALNEFQKITPVIDSKKAVIVASNDFKVPQGYHMIFYQRFPRDIPWMNGTLKIMIPEELYQQISE